ncbi:ADP,ATP carrier protein 1 [Chlamydiales bacterium SCGC AG-110-M15]|nr:ADP,ATP carrier protein 1 [Chlamydiales bacterium SCGC AG-110-M15]
MHLFLELRLNPLIMDISPFMSKSADHSFGTLRSYFWPIYSHECGRVIPMLLMAFLITFSYNILRTVKDAIVVTARGSGAETIPFIKVWALLPAALLLTFIFTRLASKLPRERVFYIMMGGFLAFFSVFIFILYPARAYLHPHETADYLLTILPAGLKGFVAVFRNWTFTGYYVMAELWGNIILSVLFWGFINEVTNVRQAKRFYGLISTGLNFAGIFSGLLSIYFSNLIFDPRIPYGHDAWEQTLFLLISTVLISGVIILLLFRHLSKELKSHNEREKIVPPKNKKKMSIRESIAYLAQSRYLLCIAFVVFAYNVVINLVEVLWKDQMKELYPDPASYNIHMNYVTMNMGIVATCISLFVTGQTIRKFGWTIAALVTPAVLLIASTAFFAALFLKTGAYDTTYALLGISPLYLVVISGSVHNVFCRGSKYTMFDITKEMAFIPLDPDEKRNGKAAIDGFGSRMGKSSGSIIHQTLLIFFGTLVASSVYVSIIVLSVIVVWIIATKALGKRFTLLNAAHEEEHDREEALRKSNKEAAIALETKQNLTAQEQIG